ncbi:hypothetical protein DFR24_4114 [Panacagrimonas perspica]|uniref:Entry exclusion lipoprotein TrbK n=1 Tax=Panacagrimonas perspica TaxID=381431 RepID=A0A4S3JZ57_9GAMM|nr:hypothetical protein [Panacagrimonas perspica]TDU25669.1 hypothetical protein DFR24_4114 [Panacagrimonas perspica]THD00714.1 hypothetical protein B1810_23520 [Panacagrimonas perspica]
MIRRTIGTTAALLLGATALTGCITASESYSSFESQRTDSCGTLTGNERDECLEHARVSFADVEKRRREDEQSQGR